MLRRSRVAGDTIIEVLLAVTIFSFLAMVTLTLMNQSVNAAQRAVEITLVRQQVDAQADMLRALHEAGARSNTPKDTMWFQIAERARANTASFSTKDGCPDPGAEDQAKHLPSGAFALAPDDEISTLDGETEYHPAGTDNNTPPYAQVESGGAYGIWIEPSTEGRSDPDAATVGAYIFRIRACWDGPGMNVPMQLETVVKLYDALDDQDFKDGP